LDIIYKVKTKERRTWRLAACDPVSTTSISVFHEIRYEVLTSRASELREHRVWKSHITKVRTSTSNIHSQCG